MLVYAVDIGGSAVKQGFVATGSSSPSMVQLRPELVLTGRSFAELRSVMLEAVSAALREAKDLDAMGISTTGTVSSAGVVLNAGHFADYRNIDWRVIIQRAHPQIKTITTVNDGRASTWAEYQLKSGECSHFCHCVIGTGIGGASVVRGSLLLGDDGNAGHFGHWRVTAAETIKCSCGKQGCLETVASAPAIVADYQRRRGIPEQSNGTLTFRDVIEHARERDAEALGALRQAGEWLGTGLSAAINLINPRYITLGGGVVSASSSLEGSGGPGPFVASAVEAAARSAHRRPAETVKIILAHYGNDGGLVGAASLASAVKQRSLSV